MNFFVRLRPTGPWRIGPSGGSRDGTDLIYRGDLLYSAITIAMRDLGMLQDWLAATAANPDGSAVRFSSCFPFIDGTDLVVPPRTLWPPISNAKIRWKGAQFVPLNVVEALIAGRQLEEDTWTVDGLSECLVPAGKSGPFRISVRQRAAVDRLNGTSSPHSVAYLEFSRNAGFWCLVSSPDHWVEPVKTAFRWLADSGFGGERSHGWGRSRVPDFAEVPGVLAGLLGSTSDSMDYWFLAPYSPAETDTIDWARGNYTVLTPGGWVANHGEAKKLVRLIAEGSVLSSQNPPTGAAPNVAPDGFPHPVYRAGFAYAIPLPAVTT